MKKTLIAGAMTVAVAPCANIAPAYVVEVTTTVSIPRAVNSDDTKPLDEAIKSAVQDVLDHAIGFTPAVVGLEDAKVVGDRLYLRLLIADEKDRATVDGLLNDGQPEPKPNERDDSESSGSLSL